MDIKEAFKIIRAKVGSEGSDEDRQLGLAAVTILEQITSDLQKIANPSAIFVPEFTAEQLAAFDENPNTAGGGEIVHIPLDQVNMEKFTRRQEMIATVLRVKQEIDVETAKEIIFRHGGDGCKLADLPEDTWSEVIADCSQALNTGPASA